MKFKMIEGLNGLYTIHIIEDDKVIGSKIFDNFEDCANALVEQMLENGMTDEEVEEAIIGLYNIDKLDIHTEFILDLLEQHYTDLENMGI